MRAWLSSEIRRKHRNLNGYVVLANHSHAQRFLSSHGAISNLFRLCRHGVQAAHYRILRGRAFDEWRQVTCAQNAG